MTGEQDPGLPSAYRGELRAGIGPKRASRLPDDPAEVERLLQLDLARLQEMYRTGERRWIGPREIEVRL
jgi:hypothetical protein